MHSSVCLFVSDAYRCRLVRDSERFTWAATRGVNEEMLMENLPEDLQRDIRRHLFKFVKKVSFITYICLRSHVVKDRLILYSAVVTGPNFPTTGRTYHRRHTREAQD